MYVIATPIGNLADMSPRAIGILAQVDLIAAEDTRTLSQLLSHFDLRRPSTALHDHNEADKVPALIEQLHNGSAIALVSDAGTPLVSDPGFRLVQAAQVEGIKVSPVPGACAPIAALSALGLPTDRFAFEGFLPAKGAAREKRLQSIAAMTMTVVLFEAPHRIDRLVDECIAIYGEQHRCGFAREITKTFETIKQLNLGELRDWLASDANQRKGEMVLVLAPKQLETEGGLSQSSIDQDKLADLLLAELPATKVAKILAKLTGGKKQALYRELLEKTGQTE